MESNSIIQLPRLLAEQKKVFWQHSVTLRYQLIFHERDKLIEIKLWNKSQCIKPLLLDMDLFEKKYDLVIKANVESRFPKPKYLLKNPVFGMEKDMDTLRREVISDLVIQIVGEQLSVQGDVNDGQELNAMLPEDILYTKPILLLPYEDKRKDINISRSFYDAFSTLRRSSVADSLPVSLRSSAFFRPFDAVLYRRENIKRIFQRVYRKVIWMNQVKATKEKLRRIETAKLLVKRRANGWKKKAEQRDRDVARSRHSSDAAPPDPQQLPQQPSSSLQPQPSQRAPQRRSLPQMPSERGQPREDARKKSDISLPRIKSKDSGLNRLGMSNRGGGTGRTPSPIKSVHTTMGTKLAHVEPQICWGGPTASSTPILSPMPSVPSTPILSPMPSAPSTPILSPMSSPPPSRKQSRSSNCLLLMTDEYNASSSNDSVSFLLSASTGQLERAHRSAIFALPSISC